MDINWRQVYAETKTEHLEESLVHATPLRNRWWYRDDFFNLTMGRMEETAEHEVWSVNSKVECFGTEGFHSPYHMHIPMMNFHFEGCANEGDMVKTINHICQNQDGAILKSGRYYHYYGNALMKDDEWHKFLAQFLMPCVLVSPRYIGHALHDGYCSLRLTADKTFKPTIPTVTKVLKRKI